MTVASGRSRSSRNEDDANHIPPFVEFDGTADRVKLLVPGYTWTPMMAPDSKPPEPWFAEQLVGYFVERLRDGDFYIIRPDHSVTPEIDAKRIRWASDDLILNRPALSR